VQLIARGQGFSIGIAVGFIPNGAIVLALYLRTFQTPQTLKELTMSTTKLSYKIVSDACQAILADNEVITIRKIHQRTGGSFSTISKHYQQWVQEQSLIT
jgi:Plasmid replication region DNA-binding N-term